MSPVSRLTVGLVWLVAVATAGQAILAGEFISGLSPATLQAHLILGSVLIPIAWLLLAAALLTSELRHRDGRVWTATWLLPVAVVVQAVLGHIGQSRSIAVHVPLGVGIFAWAGWLSAALPSRLRRSPTARSDAAPVREAQP